MRRREFITLLGGAATWPLAARAQQREQMRRIGVLMNLGSDDALGQARNAAFLQGLQELGWTVGRNVRIEYRWGGGDVELFRRYASDLVALAPDVILRSPYFFGAILAANHLRLSTCSRARCTLTGLSSSILSDSSRISSEAAM